MVLALFMLTTTTSVEESDVLQDPFPIQLCPRLLLPCLTNLILHTLVALDQEFRDHRDCS